MNVSVVIPTLNEEGNIPSCLSCLNGQIQSGDEVIVVDGGSDDNTVDICTNLGCKVFVAEESGVGMARNIGVEKASNEIIASTDADALPPDGWVEQIRSHFMNDDDLVVLWGNIQDKNGVPIRNLVGKFSTVFRGASGNNTAFRKSSFEELERKYPDISFMEDFVIISRLSRLGKAKRDKSLVMVMDMDRFRYQTVPLMGAGTIGFVASTLIDEPVADIIRGASLGVIGTELTYEDFTDSPIHHDEFGTSVAGIGKMIDNSFLSGTGIGMILHHSITEGLSFLPTELDQNTDEVVGE